MRLCTYQLFFPWIASACNDSTKSKKLEFCFFTSLCYCFVSSSLKEAFMPNQFNLTPSSKQFAEEILTVIEAKDATGDVPTKTRVLFSNGAYNFPYIINDVKKGNLPGVYTLIGVADTLERGRHYAEVEFSLEQGCGHFL
jgi:hypothetical protein